MHYRGFVIVDQLTETAVSAALAPFEGEQWDWWVIGGRHDGYLQPEDVAKARETHRGFNFDDVNRRLVNNNLPAKDLPADRRSVYFFVANGAWVECKNWVTGAPPEWEGADGAFVKDPEFGTKLDAALKRHPDGYVVVVDVHN